MAQHPTIQQLNTYRSTATFLYFLSLAISILYTQGVDCDLLIILEAQLTTVYSTNVLFYTKSPK